MAKSNLLFAATLFALISALPVGPLAAARADDLDTLFERLARPDLPDWQSVENQIWMEWSKSGSLSIDLLLERGRKALEAGDFQAAIDHLTALTDHAPDFAEGWNARATAYFSAGLYGPAIEDIRHTLLLEPRHFGALTGLGIILDELGHSEQALEAFRAAHAIHPHAPSINEAIDRLEHSVSGTDL